jgi:RNA polymerase sigma-70 factor (ECF subfamily)
MNSQSSNHVRELEGLYREGFHRFLRVAEGIAGDPEAGLEAVQEGFAGALRGIGRFRGEARLATWVWRCVVNAAKASRVPLTEQLPEELPGQAEEVDGRATVLRQLIGDLPDRQRTAVFLRYYADLEYRDIAEVLGVEVGTVGAMLSKARTSLTESVTGGHGHVA